MIKINNASNEIKFSILSLHFISENVGEALKDNRHRRKQQIVRENTPWIFLWTISNTRRTSHDEEKERKRYSARIRKVHTACTGP